VTRYRPDAGLPPPEVEATLRLEVFHTLPSDGESVQRSVLEGRPVLPGSKYARSVAALAERLAGGSTSRKPAPRRGLLSGLLR